MDLNASTILGFKYSNDKDITLTPSQASRSVAVGRLVGDSYRWFLIPEPPHDSNKLYSCFKGLPSSTWIELDLEDLGLEEHALQVPGTACQDVTWKDMVGAGWMTEESIAGPVMLACGSSNCKWSVCKLSTLPAPQQIPQHLEKQWDMVIPLVQPQRVSAAEGVYFVG
jgi:hypothetical protein